jgi:uncharacterized protein (TIGR04255 family)
MTEAASFPSLGNPPIHEVVCGFVFEPVADLDPLVLGTYWERNKSRFPKKGLQPALVDQEGFMLGPLSMRAMLESEDGQFVLQLQHDRFFVNWRAVGHVYPRFSGTSGLLQKALTEFEAYSRFVQEISGKVPELKRIELSKIDLLEKEKHWTTLEDLDALVPVTAAFPRAQGNDAQHEVNLTFAERWQSDVLIVNLATVAVDGIASALRMDTRALVATTLVPTTGELENAFRTANQRVNGVFFKLIPAAERRFGGNNA